MRDDGRFAIGGDGDAGWLVACGELVEHFAGGGIDQADRAAGLIGGDEPLAALENGE